jgi:hypothetical protein
VFGDFVGQADKFVCCVAPGAYHDDNALAFLPGADGAPGSGHDAFRRGDAGAAEFLDYQGQSGFSFICQRFQPI